MARFGTSSNRLPQLAGLIQTNVDSWADDCLLPRRCIFEVPKPMRDSDEQAFTPLAVSIGPYHFKNDKFASMESYKLTYLKSFLLHTKHTLESYLTIIAFYRNMIHNTYVDLTAPSYGDDFIQMVLVDAIFILELFRRCSDPSQAKDDLILGSNTIDQVLRDILLIENQLPFFILKKLYSHAFGIPKTRDESLTHLACKALGVSQGTLHIHSKSNEAMCCYLLDLFRSRFQPSDANPTENSARDFKNITYTRHFVSPTASHLFRTGVKFQLAANLPSNLLDISFDDKNETLTIPKLTMDKEPTRTLFMNMMAFEDCNYPFNKGTRFMDYCYFLDCLIKTPEDVKLLADVGIVDNFGMGFKALCDMFSTITAKLDRTPSSWNYYYAGQAKMLVEHGSKSKNLVEDARIIEVL